MNNYKHIFFVPLAALALCGCKAPSGTDKSMTEREEIYTKAKQEYNYQWQLRKEYLEPKDQALNLIFSGAILSGEINNSEFLKLGIKQLEQQQKLDQKTYDILRKIQLTYPNDTTFNTPIDTTCRINRCAVLQKFYLLQQKAHTK